MITKSVTGKRTTPMIIYRIIQARRNRPWYHRPDQMNDHRKRLDRRSSGRSEMSSWNWIYPFSACDRKNRYIGKYDGCLLNSCRASPRTGWWWCVPVGNPRQKLRKRSSSETRIRSTIPAIQSDLTPTLYSGVVLDGPISIKIFTLPKALGSKCFNTLTLLGGS